MLQFEIRCLKEEGTVRVLDIPQIETAAEWNAIARRHNAIYEAETRWERVKQATEAINRLSDFVFVHEFPNPSYTPLTMESIRDICGIHEPYARTAGTVLTIVDESQPEQPPILIEETEITNVSVHDGGVEIFCGEKVIALYLYGEKASFNLDINHNREKGVKAA
jgi:hypothetical protein